MRSWKLRYFLWHYLLCKPQIGKLLICPNYNKSLEEGQVSGTIEEGSCEMLFFPLLKTPSYALLSSLILSLRKQISQLFNIFPRDRISIYCPFVYFFTFWWTYEWRQSKFYCTCIMKMTLRVKFKIISNGQNTKLQPTNWWVMTWWLQPSLIYSL